MLPIPEYEDYLITEDGKVFSNKSNRYLALRPNTAGYLRVALSKGGKVREFLGLYLIPFYLHQTRKSCT